jgi:6-phosphogluconolactonase
MPRGELQICRDAEAVTQAVVDLFLNVGETAIEDRGSFSVALSGGNTPRAAYTLLGQEPNRSALSWADVHVYFGDERCVPPDDEQSNYRMADKTFLQSVAIPQANVHRMRGEIDPAEAAAEYAQTLRTNLGDRPRFDLILLGLGLDGHTASLFPGTPPDTDNDKLVRAVYAESPGMWRITMTPKVLNAGRVVAFALEGTEKAAIFCAVYEDPVDPLKYPAQIVNPTDGRLLWIADDSACGIIEKDLS